MSGGGRPRAIDSIPVELRAQIDALLDAGTPCTEIYEQFPAVQAAMELRTLQLYAAERLAERQRKIVLDEKALLNGVLDALEVEREGLTPVELAAMGVALKEMMTASKPITRLNGVLAVLNIRKDRRKEAEHGLKMKLAALKLKLESAAVPSRDTGEKVVSLETVARLMREVDMAG
jgi:DNA-binding FrmR family transcriptional regulator